MSYFMYLSRVCQVGERNMPIEQLQPVLFENDAQAQAYVNNLQEVKEKIGYWKEISYRLIPAKGYEVK